MGTQAGRSTAGRGGLRDMMRAGLLVDILAVVVLVATVAVPWFE